MKNIRTTAGFISRAIVIAFALLSLIPTLALAKSAPSKPLNKIAAIVNDDIILQSQVDKQVSLIKKQISSQNQAVPAIATLRKQVLQNLIDTRLQLQQAKNFGIQADKKMIDSAIARIAAQNHITVEQLKQSVQKQGLSYDKYRSQIRDEILIEGVQQQQAGQAHIVPSQKEIAREVKIINKSSEKYHLQAILFPVGVAPSKDEVDAVEQKAKVAIARIKGGADFMSIASSGSKGKSEPQSADMGWESLAKMPPALANKVTGALKGAIIGPIKMPNGFYIFKVVEKKVVAPKRHYIGETKVSHILIKTDKKVKDNDVKAQLNTLRDKINSGASFAKVAKENSQDTKTASKGGDLGWVTDNDVSPSFSEKMNELVINQVSKPFKTQQGWELVQVLGRRQKEDTDKYVAAQAKQIVYRHKVQEASQTWIKKLRKDAYIKIM